MLRSAVCIHSTQVAFTFERAYMALVLTATVALCVGDLMGSLLVH